MADNLTSGNPRAHAVRVYYFGTSTIYEGMPVCYDNSTTNWFGGSVADTGEVTATTTTAEGSQNEGKYIRVENPNADNVSLFAGVVKRGGWVGTTGPSVLDIYVPNGAVVPVRTDSNCLIDQTILAITTGSQELGVPLATDSRPVAIARETVDRGTAGIVLAELCPEKFLYQDMGGTALSVDDASTTTNTTVNNIKLNFLGSSNHQRGLLATGTIASTGSSLYGMWAFETILSGAQLKTAHCLSATLFMTDDCELLHSGEQANAALYVCVESTITSSNPNLSGGNLAAIMIGYYVEEGGGAPIKCYPFSINTDTTKGAFDGFFVTKQAADMNITASDAGASTHKLPIMIGGVTRYLMISDG